MRCVSIVLTCLACIGLSRRTRIASERFSGSGVAHAQGSQETVSTFPCLPSPAAVTESSTGRTDDDKLGPSRTLFMVLLAHNPVAAFSQRTMRRLLPVHKPTVSGRRPAFLDVEAAASEGTARPARMVRMGSAKPLLCFRNSNFIRNIRKALWRLPLLIATILMMQSPALASGGGAPVTMPTVPLTQSQLLARSCLWLGLFCLAATFAAAETAVTTLSPFKVKQLVAQEGERSPFRVLESDMEKVLQTVIIGVTFCTIYTTALVTDIAIGIFGSRGVGYATFFSTFVTLFLGEILPKSLAVTKPESVARFTLPLINAVSFVLTPLNRFTSLGIRRLRGIVGEEESPEAVTKPELRMVLNSAAKAGGVELYEEDMIEGVLDLQRTQVQKIMTPRVEIEAVERNASLADVIDLALRSKYSRIPVYNETVDEIVGIVLARELLEYNAKIQTELVDSEAGHSSVTQEAVAAITKLATTQVSSVMDGVDGLFVPMSMSAMKALKMMRQERVHMMFVVDEFGGTSGIVTLEDILETLVGAIYDEDDEEEYTEDTTEIVPAEDGSYTIEGNADLSAVLEQLELESEVPEDIREDFTTLSGFLCHYVGEILSVGDHLLIGNKRFEVLEADERRLLSVKATNILSSDKKEPGKEANRETN